MVRDIRMNIEEQIKVKRNEEYEGSYDKFGSVKKLVKVRDV